MSDIGELQEIINSEAEAKLTAWVDERLAGLRAAIKALPEGLGTQMSINGPQSNGLMADVRLQCGRVVDLLGTRIMDELRGQFRQNMAREFFQRVTQPPKEKK